MAASGAAAAGAASDEGGAENAKMEARAGAGDSWGDNGSSGASWPAWSGQW